MGSSPSILHLRTLYAKDESREGYAYSGDALRTRAVMRVVAGNSAKSVKRIRMRGLLRANHTVPKDDLVELRFSISSTPLRMVMGALGLLGSKQALFFMDYFSNGFDHSAISRIVEESPAGVVLLFDELSSFSMVGWNATNGGLGRARRIFLSHDYEPDFVRTRYIVPRVRKRINACLKTMDLVIAASEADRLKYVRNGGVDEGKVLVYPNIFLSGGEDARYAEDKAHELFTIVAVQRGWSGLSGAKEDARELADALKLIPRTNLRVVAIGPHLGKLLRAEGLSPNIDLHSYPHIPSRADFIGVLSRAHVGLNLARWAGGTNVKKYDYCIAAVVVLSNVQGSRGQAVPYEWVFTDARDLASKLVELSAMGGEELARMGMENRERVSSISKEATEELRSRLRTLGL